MSQKYFLPRGDEARANWLVNFAEKLPPIAARYGITLAETENITRSATYFRSLVQLQLQVAAFSQALTRYKNAMRDGTEAFESIPTVPAIPTLQPIQGPIPVFDIFGQVRAIVGRIKSHYYYNDVDGAALGIQGSAEEVQLQDIKPQLTARISHGGQPEIVWFRQGMTGVALWVDRGDGWAFLAFDTIPDYIDTHVLPAGSAVWSYKAQYRLGDDNVGQWSDVVTIAVKQS